MGIRVSFPHYFISCDLIKRCIWITEETVQLFLGAVRNSALMRDLQVLEV